MNDFDVTPVDEFIQIAINAAQCLGHDPFDRIVMTAENNEVISKSLYCKRCNNSLASWTWSFGGSFHLYGGLVCEGIPASLVIATD